MAPTHPPLRVLHATECLGAGTLQVMRALSAALAEHGAEQTVVYSLRDETPPDIPALFPAGTRLIEVPRANGSQRAFVAGLAKTLQRECQHWQPQHVHLHSSKAGFVGRLALRRHAARMRVYYSPHGLSYLDPARPWRNAVFKSLERMAGMSGVVPVACGQGEAALLRQVSRGDVQLLENPVDERFFSVQRRAETRPTVATVGRISRQKAPETFAAVARLVALSHPTVRMVWVGDGDPAGRRLLEAAGCEVTGWVDREQVAGWMAQSAVYLQTSLWEGLPVSVLQAMAAALPCVVSNVVGNRDAIRHGLSGLIADDAAAMARGIGVLIDDSNLRQQMGQYARANARGRFSHTAFRDSVARLYGLG